MHSIRRLYGDFCRSNLCTAFAVQPTIPTTLQMLKARVRIKLLANDKRRKTRNYTIKVQKCENNSCLAINATKKIINK